LRPRRAACVSRSEFSDERWLCPDLFNILEHHQAACIHDMLKNHPRHLTAESTYLRYHGDHYSGSYSDQQLSREAGWINRQLSAGWMSSLTSTTTPRAMQ
jgi:Protein of unknown function DUF72